MSDQEHPQIYLVTPPVPELSKFPGTLAALLDQFDIACVRLSLASTDASEISRTADILRETCHAREVALVIQEHHRLVEPLGLDGVHLSDGATGLRDIRKSLGQDAIVGAFCGTSRHAGMTAGEIGADYICFGPITDDGLGSGDTAELDLFEWWSAMVELPVVAEGGLTLETVERLAPVVDWVALGPEIWTATDGPQAALAEYIDRLQ